MANIGPGFYEAAARRSARNALIRNAIFALILLGSMGVWLTQGAERSQLVAVLVVEGLFAALFIWRALVGLGRLRNPLAHPLFTDFAPYGDPLTLATEIETAVAQGKARRVGSFTVTDRFLVATGFSHAVVAFTDVAWVYGKVTKHSVNLIPVGTTRSLELFTFSPAHRDVSLSLEADEGLLETLRAGSPRAHFGFTPENEKWWEHERRSLRQQKAGSSYQSRGP